METITYSNDFQFFLKHQLSVVTDLNGKTTLFSLLNGEVFKNIQHFNTYSSNEETNLYKNIWNKLEKEPLNNDWICTDPDNQQYGRKIKKNVFEFKERGEHLVIDLTKYSQAQKESFIASYYGNIQNCKNECGLNYLWILAECIFEQESGLY